jgi:hypothetical protein
MLISSNELHKTTWAYHNCYNYRIFDNHCLTRKKDYHMTGTNVTAFQIRHLLMRDSAAAAGKFIVFVMNFGNL